MTGGPSDLLRAGRMPGGGQRFDVCNGDADGLCAVLQWRLHDPQPATLVTGLKRDIELLGRVNAGAGDEVLVCDISMDRNRPALLRLLSQGVRVRYFDHHRVVDPPSHPLLESHIDFGVQVCTSILVDRQLGGACRRWACVGAYGDNLTEAADALAGLAGLASEERAQLRKLGEAINYNAYGEDEGDLHIAPARLFEVMRRHPDPLDMWRHEPVAAELVALRRADLKLAAGLAPHWTGDRASVHLLPDAPWSRRVVGTLANQLARAEPGRAHALLKPDQSSGYQVSVRAPVRASGGADVLCSRFGGSGRAGAAGIDHLPADALERFIREFTTTDWPEHAR